MIYFFYRRQERELVMNSFYDNNGITVTKSAFGRDGASSSTSLHNQFSRRPAGGLL